MEAAPGAIYITEAETREFLQAAHHAGKFGNNENYEKVLGKLFPELTSGSKAAASTTIIHEAAPSAKKGIYVMSQSAEQIANWTAELSRLSPKDQAKWRGKVWHITGFMMPVRWNKDVQSYEIGIPEPLKKHNSSTVHFPKGDWAPVVQDRIMPSDETMAHYYEPEVFTRGGPTLVYVVRHRGDFDGEFQKLKELEKK